MKIAKKEDFDGDILVDLTGPEGNAFCLMGYAKKWAVQLGREPAPILADMKSGNYEHLVDVMEKEFGSFATFLR